MRISALRRSEPEPVRLPSNEPRREAPAPSGSGPQAHKQGLRDRMRSLRGMLNLERCVLAAALLLGLALRVWQINRFGVNSDEAVYAGQAAALHDVPELAPYFPAFRAHPLLFQTMLSFAFHLGEIDLWGRVLSALVGLANVVVVYKLGGLLYGRRAGAIAAVFMSLMPYHVLVSRQILLDGPMTLFATLTLYLIARYASDRRPAFLFASAGAMACAVLSKETSMVLLGGIYAFFALTPEIRLRVRDVIGSGALLGGLLFLFPLSLKLAGKTESGGNYLAWQLFRRPNHEWTFYPTTVPEAIGWLVVLAAIAGLWLLRNERTWRETLLLSWMAVPIVFFQIWPVKGYQYLLPIAPAVAVLAAHMLSRWPATLSGQDTKLARIVTRRSFRGAAIGVIAFTLALTSFHRIQPDPSGSFLAGSGGVPGGREAGRWIDSNVPTGSRFMTVGPSMANIIQFYGHRKAYGLSVSPNPLHRNPSYEPLLNPDQLLRNNELHYVVWDSFSAARSPFFAASVKRYADRFKGRVVHSESLKVKTKDGRTVRKPLITIYEVRPS